MQSRLLRYSALALGASSALAVASAAAQSPRETVVAATRIETAASRFGGSATVLDGAELERRGYQRVVEALETVPGVAVTRTGGVGGAAVVRIRGAGQGQVLVRIDGVAVNDPAAPNDAFDFGALLVSDVERIEVLRGPQTALYGADAMGGVIDIVTRKGGGETKVATTVEAGSFGTARGSASISGAVGVGDFALSATYLRTDGYSRAADGEERDGARVATLNASFGADLTHDVRLEGSFGAQRTHAETDGFGVTRPIDDEGRTEDESWRGRLGLGVTSLDGRLENTLAIHGYESSRDDRGGFGPSIYDGERRGAEWRADYAVDADDVLTIGAETEYEAASFESAFGDFEASAWSRALYGQYLFGVGDFTATLGARQDWHETFGDAAAFRVALAYEFVDSGTILRASYGTGRKAPSLYQLFDPFYGAPDLRPEKSRGGDVGVEQSFWDDRATVAVTAFYAHYEDLIGFHPTTFRSVNIDRARVRGVETALDAQLTPTIYARASYAYLRAEDARTGEDLPRRPRHAGSLAVDWDATEALRLGAALRYQGSADDSAFSAAGQDARTIVDLTGEYDFSETVTGFARIENALDHDYEEPVGYQGQPFAGYVGVRARF